MKRIITLSVVAVAVCVCLTASATADIPLIWVNSPNSNTGGPTTAVSWVGGDLIIGTPTEENGYQPEGIYGAGAALPTGYSEFLIRFDWEFNTWDSYNAPGTPNPPYNGGTGWYDSFSATITKGDYYWNQSLADPIDGDVEQILLLEGGTSYGEGFLETYSGPWSTFVFTPPDDDQYYLNLVIDTSTGPEPKFDVLYPSWGEFSDVSVVPVPGAVLLGMLGLSVAGIKLRKFA